MHPHREVLDVGRLSQLLCLPALAMPSEESPCKGLSGGLLPGRALRCRKGSQMFAGL